MTHRTHGDGHGMSVAEATERRARMILVHGSLAEAKSHSWDMMLTVVCDAHDHHQSRAWTGSFCVECIDEYAKEAGDVGVRGGDVVPMCANCRGDDPSSIADH